MSWLLVVLAASVALAEAVEPFPIIRLDDQTVRCRQGVVVSVNGLASDTGLAILKQGGNAVDAAIATAFALAVTHPAAGNIGGGGYMLVRPASGEPVVFDFREVAPAKATADMFVRKADRTPHRTVGVPGTVRGLELAHRRLGRLKWNELVEPAVRLASEGFELDASTAISLNGLLTSWDPAKFPELHRVFTKPGGGAWDQGERLKLPELAHTLELIAARGADGFYLGETAEKLAAEMRQGGGLITTQDLADYRPVERKPLRGTYRGYELLASPPSSSGGTTLLEALNILETFQLTPDRNAPANVHRLAESLRRAYCDRARWLGDPAFTTIPEHLLTKEHGRELAASITERATPSRELAGEIRLAPETEHTTHFSVVDRERSAVSLTYTLENSYGSKVVVRGAGFLLNNEMNDFNPQPGVTDAKGRIGTDANLVRPGARPLSSMCPVVVLKGGQPVLVTGSPGGRTIISTVFCVVTDAIDFGLDVRSAVDAPRLYQPWFPDVLSLEKRWLKSAADLADELRGLGHTVKLIGEQGDAHSIAIDPATGELTGAADRRLQGKASGY